MTRLFALALAAACLTGCSTVFNRAGMRAIERTIRTVPSDSVRQDGFYYHVEGGHNAKYHPISVTACVFLPGNFVYCGSGSAYRDTGGHYIKVPSGSVYGSEPWELGSVRNTLAAALANADTNVVQKFNDRLGDRNGWGRWHLRDGVLSFATVWVQAGDILPIPNIQYACHDKTARFHGDAFEIGGDRYVFRPARVPALAGRPPIPSAAYRTRWLPPFFLGF